jgi:hypothetical protein
MLRSQIDNVVTCILVPKSGYLAKMLTYVFTTDTSSIQILA